MTSARSLATFVLASAVLAGCSTSPPETDAVQKLRDLDARKQPAEICSDSDLHIVGIYTTGTGQATVRVSRPGPSTLVLSAYEQTHWTVIPDNGAVIERVILNGYHRQSATVPPGVPVDSISYEAIALYWPIVVSWPTEAESDRPCEADFPEDFCEYLVDLGLDWRRVTYQEDYLAHELIDEAQRVTGRALATFHGCYRMSDITILPHQDGGAPGDIPNDCDEPAGYTLDVHFAEEQAGGGTPLPGDGTDDDATCGSSILGRGIPTTGPCALQSGPGFYEMFSCDGDGGSISTQSIYCEDALENCLINAVLNPDVAVTCTWNGLPIFEQFPGYCTR